VLASDLGEIRSSDCCVGGTIRFTGVAVVVVVVVVVVAAVTSERSILTSTVVSEIQGSLRYCQGKSTHSWKVNHW